MAFGFFFMSKASTEVVMDGDDIVEKSAMIWLVLAYLFVTVIFVFVTSFDLFSSLAT